MASRRRAFTLSILSVSALVAAGLPASQALASTTAAAGITIQVETGGKCLNVSGAGTANNAKVVQYGCTAAATNDHWQLVPQSNGSYQVKGVGSGKCLTVSNASTANNAPLIIYTCTTGGNETWWPEEVAGRPTVRIRSMATDKCVNVPGASTANNVQLVQYACTATGAGNERLYFPPTTSASPVARPFTPDRPIAVLQGGLPSGAAEAPVHFSWVDSEHQLNMLTDFAFDPSNGTQQDPNWIATQNLYGFTGPTSSTLLNDGRVQIVAHDAQTGDAFVTDENVVGSGEYPFLDDMGGTSATHPSVGLSNPATKSLAVFTTVNGVLWAAPEAVGDPLPAIGGWRNLGGSGLVGTPVSSQTGTGTQVFALNSAGQIQTATFTGNNTLSDWVNLGGTGLTGTPSVSVFTGYRHIVFSNTTTGTIVYKEQNVDLSWPGDWTSAPGLTAVGSPSSVMQPANNAATVAARDADGNVYYAAETSEASGTLTDWHQLSDPADPASQSNSDPTLFSYVAPTGSDFGVAFSTKDPGVEVPYYYYFTPNTAYPLPTSGAAVKSNAKSTAKKPALHKLETGTAKAKKLSLR
jgi:hypothetical protein